jgi:hypothetical protein
VHEWEVRTSDDYAHSGECESLTEAWNEAFDSASGLLDRSAHDARTIEVEGEQVYVLPGSLWVRESDNINATRAVLESLRSELLAAIR